MSANKKMIISLSLILMLMLSACSKGSTPSETPANASEEAVKETVTENKAETQKTADTETKKAEESTATVNVPEKKVQEDGVYESDDDTFMNAEGIICDMSGREDLSGYSEEELIEKLKTEKYEPVLFNGMSAEELDFIFKDFNPEAEYTEETDVYKELEAMLSEEGFSEEELLEMQPETYEAVPYNADAPWQDMGVVYTEFDEEEETLAAVGDPKAGDNTENASLADGDEKYSFLTLTNNAVTSIVDGDWMASMPGDNELCKVFIEEVKEAGYTIDAEVTEFMGMLMYEAKDSTGEKVSVVANGSTVVIVFENGD